MRVSQERLARKIWKNLNWLQIVLPNFSTSGNFWLTDVFTVKIACFWKKCMDQLDHRTLHTSTNERTGRWVGEMVTMDKKIHVLLSNAVLIHLYFIPRGLGLINNNCYLVTGRRLASGIRILQLDLHHSHPLLAPKYNARWGFEVSQSSGILIWYDA